MKIDNFLEVQLLLSEKNSYMVEINDIKTEMMTDEIFEYLEKNGVGSQQVLDESLIYIELDCGMEMFVEL